MVLLVIDDSQASEPIATKLLQDAYGQHLGAVTAGIAVVWLEG